jgi:phosphoserine phosphatase SerB
MANSDYQLTLISAGAISPKLDTIKAELTARGFDILSQRDLNPEFETNAGDPMGDAYSITFQADLAPGEEKTLSQHLSTTFTLDAIIQASSLAETSKKLVCFEESFYQRLACLKGFDASLIPGIANSLKLTPGAEILVKTLRTRGTKITILSGGFENFAIFLQRKLGPLDAIYSNILEIKDGKLTGNISNELVSEFRKLDLIKELAEIEGLNANQTIAVGDGANDIPMLLHAGLGIAYRAKPLVQEKAPHCINHNGLAAILYVLGYQRSEFIEL